MAEGLVGQGGDERVEIGRGQLLGQFVSGELDGCWRRGFLRCRFRLLSRSPGTAARRLQLWRAEQVGLAFAPLSQDPGSREHAAADEQQRRGQHGAQDDLRDPCRKHAAQHDAGE